MRCRRCHNLGPALPQQLHARRFRLTFKCIFKKKEKNKAVEKLYYQMIFRKNFRKFFQELRKFHEGVLRRWSCGMTLYIAFANLPMVNRLFWVLGAKLNWWFRHF